MKHSQDSKDLKSIIIDTAQEVFGKFGLRKATMDEIATKVNKAKGALYYYFRSKEEVYEAVLEKEADAFRDEIIRSINGQSDPQERIKAYVLTRMKLFHKLANFYTTFQKEYLDNYAFIQRIRKKYDEEELLIIASILEEGKKTHQLVIRDVPLTALAILTAMKGFEYAWSLENDRRKTEVEVDFLLEILFYGLVKR